MIKKCIALVTLTFAMHGHAANVTTTDARDPAYPLPPAGWYVADNCQVEISGCDWEEVDGLPPGYWELIVEHRYTEVYATLTPGRLAVRVTENVPKVPLPAAGWLFVSALAALGIAGRKRAARS